MNTFKCDNGLVMLKDSKLLETNPKISGWNDILDLPLDSMGERKWM